MRHSTPLRVVLVGTFVAFAAGASAAPPRRWTDAGGTYTVQAELVEVKNGNVLLKKADGEVITVPVNKLSEADRNYLSNRAVTKAVEPAPADRPAASDEKGSSGSARLGDTDGDGKISRAEWSKLAQRFRDLDVDKDSALDPTELEATGAAESLAKLADADGDGKLQRNEWAQLAQSFPRLDKNKDGAIDAAELQAAEEAKVARASGTATLPSSARRLDAGPTVWRGRIEGRGMIELTVAGNRIVGTEFGGGGSQGQLGTGTFTMTGDGKIGNMDAVYIDGPHQGEVCLGIYQMEGDTLRWCVSNRPGQRPSDFSTGRGNWLMTLTRVPANP